jgi:ribosomal protein S18 acetylase RimI-like enzyme
MDPGDTGDGGRTMGGTSVLDPRDVVAALTDTYQAMTASIGGSIGREAEVSWGIAPISLNVYNRVMRPRFEPGGAGGSAATVDQRIADLVARFDAAHVASTWWLDPASSPPDLAERLRASGYVESRDPARIMSRELGDLPPVSLPVGFEAHLVRDADEMAAAQVLGLVGNGLEVAEAQGIGSALASTTAPGGAVQSLVVRHGDRIVGSCTSVTVGDVVGLYTLATAPDMRRHGIGTAATLLLMEAARDRGARYAVLEASRPGHSL